MTKLPDAGLESAFSGVRSQFSAAVRAAYWSNPGQERREHSGGGRFRGPGEQLPPGLIGLAREQHQFVGQAHLLDNRQEARPEVLWEPENWPS